MLSPALMPWTPVLPAPIVHLDPNSGAPTLRIFHGKPHALAFLSDGSLVVGGSQAITLHDPSSPTPPRACVAIKGGVRWMVAHPDGESVVAAVHGPHGWSLLRAWPASGRLVTLLQDPDFGHQFCGGLSPDGERVFWRRPGVPPVLFSVDATTGAPLGELVLPQDANRAGALAVRRDGALYLPSDKMLIIHPDGRIEERSDSPFFIAPDPFFAADDGAMVGTGSQHVAYDGERFRTAGDLSDDANVGTVSHDRRRLTFHASLGQVLVWDVADQRVVFSCEQERAIGGIPGWLGQSAAASATHVAAIDHADASVTIWSIDDAKRPIATLTGYSQGARRLMFHGGLLTVHTCQPRNSRNSVMELDLTTGAARMLEHTWVCDIARTSDGQRLLVMRDSGASIPCRVDLFDPAGELLETIEVERGAGELALAPDDTIWGVASHTVPSNFGAEPVVHTQWRAFGANKSAKKLKARGREFHVALGDTAAAVLVGEQLTIVELAKGKTLQTLTLPSDADAVAIRRDGAYVALACYGTPLLVDVTTGELIELALALPGKKHFSHSVCFAGDDSLLVGFRHGAITQHRVPSGEQLAALYGHTDKVHALAWVDGALWSGSEDGTILRWELS